MENNGMSMQELIGVLLHKMWLIILLMIIGGGSAYAFSIYVLVPTYTANVSMYVNRNTEQIDNELRLEDLNVAQELVATYIEILKSNTVLNKVIDRLNLSYNTGELRKMISATAVSNTEIFNVEVTANNPEEAADIANMLVQVVPDEINKVVQAGGVKLIDGAKANYDPASPNIEINILIGSLLGGIIAILFIILKRLLDTTVRSVTDLEKRYDNIPILGILPDKL